MQRQRHYRNPGEGGECIFATTTLLDFVHLFQREKLRNLVAASLIDDFRHYEARLDAFVVMTHHIHFVGDLPERRSAPWFLERIKSNAAVRLLPQMTDEEHSRFDQQRGLNSRTLWQVSYRSFLVSSPETFWQKVRYCHENPVRAGLVEDKRDYRWSSANLFAEERWHHEHGLTDLEALAHEFASADELALKAWRGRRSSPPEEL